MYVYTYINVGVYIWRGQPPHRSVPIRKKRHTIHIYICVCIYVCICISVVVGQRARLHSLDLGDDGVCRFLIGQFLEKKKNTIYI